MPHSALHRLASRGFQSLNIKRKAVRGVNANAEIEYLDRVVVLMRTSYTLHSAG